MIAPLFYMLIGGAVLGFTYKAINTMDSMVGYKNDKYQVVWNGSSEVRRCGEFHSGKGIGSVDDPGCISDRNGWKECSVSSEETALIIARTLHRQKQSWRGRWMCSLQEMHGI